jgi:hypothetical protein
VQRGYLAISLVFLIILLSLVAYFLMDLAQNSIAVSMNGVAADKALYTAEGGLEWTGTQLANPNGNDEPYCSNLANKSLPTIDAGTQLSLQGKESSLAHLSQSISSTQTITSLTLDNTSSFAANGSVQIDNEIFSYTDKSASKLLNVSRAQAASPMEAHANNAWVAQNGCIVDAIGSAPPGNQPNGVRHLQNWFPYSQLYFAGTMNGSNVLFRVQRNQCLNLSTQDTYTALKNSLVLPDPYPSFLPTAFIISGKNTAVNAASCIGTDCWMVGDAPAVGQGPLLIHLQNGIYTLYDIRSFNDAKGNNLHAIQCPSLQSCYAVGDKGLLLVKIGSTWQNFSTCRNTSVNFLGVWWVGNAANASAWRELHA